MPDYDLAKAIPGSGESTPQSEGSKSIQYIVNEIFSKQKSKSTYIPPSGTRLEHHATQDSHTEHLHRPATPSTKQREYPQAKASEPAEFPRARAFSGKPPELQQVGLHVHSKHEHEVI